LIPIVCVLAGVGFLREPLTSQIIFGGALTVFGVWLASRVAKDIHAVNEASESVG
jgi:drug/metabolite transporter (DMT)-like permease